MVQKLMRIPSFRLTAFFYMLLLITSCQSDERKVDLEDSALELKVHRFEKDLFALDTAVNFTAFNDLRERHRQFFDLFAFQITRLGNRDSLETIRRLQGFVNDTNFRKVVSDIQLTFGDFSPWKQELTKAFKYYHHYFPDKEIPSIYTYLSVFSYPVVADSSILGLGLDMYLGQDYFYYHTLDPPLPLFLRKRMQPDYLVADAMRGWAASDYSVDDMRAKLVELIISEGRLIYFLEKVMPDAPDTIISGYDAGQLSWLKNNESKIWAFFLDNKLLFSDDLNILMKYANEGPTTNGFPAESPGNLGKYIGWQIVHAFMKNHPEITLRELMEEKDLNKLFQESTYKPGKNK